MAWGQLSIPSIGWGCYQISWSATDMANLERVLLLRRHEVLLLFKIPARKSRHVYFFQDMWFTKGRHFMLFWSIKFEGKERIETMFFDDRIPKRTCDMFNDPRWFTRARLQKWCRFSFITLRWRRPHEVQRQCPEWKPYRRLSGSCSQCWGNCVWSCGRCLFANIDVSTVLCFWTTVSFERPSHNGTNDG